MNLIREVMIRNFQISFVTNVKFDFKARGTQMGRPYPAQYLGRGVPGSELTVLSITMPIETILILDGFSRNNINSNYSY